MQISVIPLKNFQISKMSIPYIHYISLATSFYVCFMRFKKLSCIIGIKSRVGLFSIVKSNMCEKNLCEKTNVILCKICFFN